MILVSSQSDLNALPNGIKHLLFVAGIGADNHDSDEKPTMTPRGICCIAERFVQIAQSV
ncbi:hypothetical protein OAE79_02080 [Rhodopirellula sp.]|nr:hypothetical protein [Rhodopirellula sp.]